MRGKQPFAGGPISLRNKGGIRAAVLIPPEGAGERCLGCDLGRVGGISPDSARPHRTPVMERMTTLAVRLTAAASRSPGCWLATTVVRTDSYSCV